MARLGQSGSGGLVIHFTLASRFCDRRAGQCRPHYGSGLERVDRGDHYRRDFNRGVSESAALGGVDKPPRGHLALYLSVASEL